MKYKIGDNVYYNLKKYVICGAYENTRLEIKPNSFDDGECKSASLSIAYDLRDENGKVICNIGEHELMPELDLTNYEFSEGVEYALRNGLIVTYCDICDTLETDDGIEIPTDLYRKDGTCISFNDFDIVNKKKINNHDECYEKWYENSVTDAFTKQEEDKKEEDKKDEEIKEKNSSIKLKIGNEDDGYYIQILDKPYGFGVMGELPDNMKETFQNIVSNVAKIFNDWR